MQILTALALAIVPVLNSFMILFILACMCEGPAHAPLRARLAGTSSHFPAPRAVLGAYKIDALWRRTSKMMILVMKMIKRLGEARLVPFRGVLAGTLGIISAQACVRSDPLLKFPSPPRRTLRPLPPAPPLQPPRPICWGKSRYLAPETRRCCSSGRQLWRLRCASVCGRAGAVVGVSLFAKSVPESFGSFDSAFMTLFYVTGGDPWPDAVPKYNEDG